LPKATCPCPPTGIWHQSGGKRGIHTEHLGYLLAELQVLARAHPGAKW
jgi:ring-1,2-phenylacetyl-CoA epoxidase subunit PaaC